MQIRAVGPDDLGLLRDVRARALAADPDAFVITVADQAPGDRRAWAVLAGLEQEPAPLDPDAPPRRYAAVLLALDDEQRPLGMAGIRWFDPEQTTISLWGMWVDPLTRGTGLGRRMVDAVGQWGTHHGASSFRLGVFVRDGDATGFYKRLGFTDSGVARAFNGRPAISMTRPLS